MWSRSRSNKPARFGKIDSAMTQFAWWPKVKGERLSSLSGDPKLVEVMCFHGIQRIWHIRAMSGTGEPFTVLGGRVTLSLSSTWGRADQQTSQDSNRVWGVLFCAENFGSLAQPCKAHLESEICCLALPPWVLMVVDWWRASLAVSSSLRSPSCPPPSHVVNSSPEWLP